MYPMLKMARLIITLLVAKLKPLLMLPVVVVPRKVGADIYRPILVIVTLKVGFLPAPV